MKKTVIIVLGFAVLLSCFWICSILKTEILTLLFQEEFKSPSEIGVEHMTYFEEPFDLKIMSYGCDVATVYYYSNAGGEKMEFEKKDGKWCYRTTISGWSDRGGSADDFFIFPFYKKPIF